MSADVKPCGYWILDGLLLRTAAQLQLVARARDFREAILVAVGLTSAARDGTLASFTAGGLMGV
jgi:hypothetical protein